MKSKAIIGILLLITLSTGHVIPAIGSGDHAHSDLTEHAAADQCAEPTEILEISAPASGLLTYERDEYHVEKNTCYEFIFHNKSPIDHDVNIEHYEDHGMEEVHLHAANSTAGEHNDGTTTMNVQTPNEDTELTLYCSVSGHKSAGMSANLVVGEGEDNSNSLPFSWAYTLIGLLGLGTLEILRRKK